MAETQGKHPAPFTDSIIEALAALIPEHVPIDHGVHDPFAGEGSRLGALCDRLGYVFTGVDLEEWPKRDIRVLLGDSTNALVYPSDPFAIVTSPTYNNGVNDHFDPKDTSRRLTYRAAAGHALHPNNTGRWSGRGSKKGEAEYWRITRDCVKHWPNVALVNVKNSQRAGEKYLLEKHWSDLLYEYGYEVDQVDVPCPGWRVGSNSQARAATEAILIAVRP